MALSGTDKAGILEGPGSAYLRGLHRTCCNCVPGFQVSRRIAHLVRLWDKANVKDLSIGYLADVGKRWPSFAGEQVAFHFLQIEMICAGRLDVA